MKHTRTLAVLMLAACTGGAFANDTMMMDKMKMMDTNGDGMISKAENDAYSSKHFDMMDANKDGMVSSAEMKAGMDMKMDMMKDGKMKDGKMMKDGMAK